MRKKILKSVGSLSVAGAMLLTQCVPSFAYTVQKGDTLGKIAAANNTTVSELMQLNGISNANQIFVGENLKVSKNDNTAITRKANGTVAKNNNQTSTKLSAKDKALLEGMFDAEFYAKQNPDVVEAMGDDEETLFNHFVNFGLWEGRQVNSEFNVSAYASAYSDLTDYAKDSGMSQTEELLFLYEHYENFGKSENREITTIEKAAEKGVTVVSVATAVDASGNSMNGEILSATSSSSAQAPSYVPPEPEKKDTSKYTVLKDENGNVFDLGGMEIYIRDWYSSDWRDSEPENEYEKAVYDYRSWVEETYNFKIHTTMMGDWASCANDFVDYVSKGGDDINYVWTLYSGNEKFLDAARKGLAYDLSSIDCLNFDDSEYADNSCHKLYAISGGIYGMHAGPSEPRTGVIYNRRLLAEAGVDPDLPYDMQANGTWTWEAFEKLCATVQRDTDGDGTVDIWAIGCNEGVGIEAAVFSNGGQFVGLDDNGNYTYEIENPKTVEALEWILDIYQKYDWNGPLDEANNPSAWDYYQSQFRDGKAVFCFDQEYCFEPGNLFYNMEDELGFVMFPMGPNGESIQSAEDNVYAIPGCYDAERAGKIAFAYDVFNAYVPGYEDYNPYADYALEGNVDDRVVETVRLMGKKNMVALENVIPNAEDFMNMPFLWAIGPDTVSTVEEIIDGVRDLAKSRIDEANK